MRTAEEKQKAIEDLKRLKNKLPEFSKFGDENWKIIDLQIDIVEERITDDDELYDLEDEEEFEDVSILIDTLEWVNGNDDIFYDGIFKGGFDNE